MRKWPEPGNEAAKPEPQIEVDMHEDPLVWKRIDMWLKQNKEMYRQGHAAGMFKGVVIGEIAMLPLVLAIYGEKIFHWLFG